MSKISTFLIFFVSYILIPINAIANTNWNNSSQNKNSAAHWAKTSVNNLEGFICNKKVSNTYKSRGKKVKHINKNGLTVFQIDNGEATELPDYLYPCVNDKTLNHFYSKWNTLLKDTNKYKIRPSAAPSQLKFLPLNSKFLDKQLQHNEILSYLFYDNGIVKYDELAPQNRFKFSLSNNTLFISNSVGKSIISYLAGHAICDGYIKSVDENLGSWPLIKNTLYGKLKLIQLLNMRARDQHVVNESDGFLKTGQWINPVSIRNAASLHVDATEPNEISKFNYNMFTANLVMNFIRFKVGKDWNSFLSKIFQDKIGISNSLVFQKVYGFEETHGLAIASGWVSRYDYLRIAVSIMKDWQKGTCVGQYLKETNERKKPITKDSWFFDIDPKDARNKRHFSSHYGGLFYFNYKGMNKRNIIGMEGKGGQSILIDVDNSRVVVVNAVSDNYDWYELVYQTIKTGNLRKQ